MSLKLEKYLSAQRSNLDVESPDDKSIWDGIEKKLQAKTIEEKRREKRTRLIQFRNIAAAALILFSLGYITNDIIKGRNSGRNMRLSSISSELGKREKEYKAMVSYKTDEVSPFTRSDNTVVIELFEEIRKLDMVYSQALNDLKDLGANEKVINTIFDTYEQKIHLLELIILETSKTESHENNEKIIL